MNKKIIIIYGPTGVGKTEFGLDLARCFNGSIINADMGQLYKPLSIGTAKPFYKTDPIKHYLFDYINDPINFSVLNYKKVFQEACQDAHMHNKVPFVIGGTGFYLKSLFMQESDYVDKDQSNNIHYESLIDTITLYNQLCIQDPARGLEIHPHDTYRIQKALHILSLGKKPSECKPIFKKYSDTVLFICLTRPINVLYNRINERTYIMLQEGWINEVEGLQNTLWEDFLKRKKIIGYSDIFDYLNKEISYNDLVRIISQKTRNYAKRQMTFWRMLKKKLSLFFLEHQQGMLMEFLIEKDNDSTKNILFDIVDNFLKKE